MAWFASFGWVNLNTDLIRNREPPGYLVEKQSNMTLSCTERILDLVASLQLEEGDRLPGERKLAQHLGSSRNTVRESLVMLAAQGHIEVRCRSGCYFLSASPFASCHDIPADTENTIDTLRAVGPHLAFRTAENCSFEEGCRLNGATAQMKHCLYRRAATQTMRAYVLFFASLAIFVGNPYLERMMKAIAAAHGRAESNARVDKVEADVFYALHVNLVETIQAHNPRRAQHLVEHGLNAFAAMMGHAESSRARGYAS